MSKQSFTTGQVLTAAQVNSLQANDYNQSVSVKTASYTLAAADKGTRIEFNTSGSVTCTVNSGLFDAGDTLVIQNRGAGAATVTAGTATVNTSASLVVKQYDSGVLYFVSDSSAIYFASDAADTPLTTKGDLFTFSTAADRLAVGNSGDTIVADSSATTGLRWQGNFAAGKSKIINGAFDHWQRGTSFTDPDGTYTADRFISTISGGNKGTATRQTFTAGAAPVAGYEGQYFLRYVGNSTATYMELQQRIEDVRTLAGQTVTLSFWAKASSSVTFTPLLRQNFGSGGSANVDTSGSGIALTSSFVRYSVTLTLPSLSGKTIGTSSYLGAFIYTSAGTVASNTVEFWGVQLEAGNTATAFQTATGTLAGELAACQRYYSRSVADSSNSFAPFAQGISTTATTANIYFTFPVPMRVNPTSIGQANLCISDLTNYNLALTNLVINQTTTRMAALDATSGTGATALRPAFLRSNNSATGYLEVSAEL